MAERIGLDSFDEKVLQSELPVLVDFYSDSCIPCKMLSPVLADIADDREGNLELYKVNTNFEEDLVEQYSIKGAPTLILFENGEIRARRTGAAKREELDAWLDENL